MGLKTFRGNEAFYFLNDGGMFKGAVLTHADDFTLARHVALLNMVMEGIKLA